MLIQDDGINNFVYDRLTEFALSTPATECKCPHCGIPVRYPVIARKSDVEDFRRLMIAAFDAMKKFGISANLFAEITANCHIEIARRKSKENGMGL